MLINLNINAENIKWVKQDEFRTNCPICNDNKMHLYVNVSKNVFFCFKCTNKGILKTNSLLISNNDKRNNFTIPQTITNLDERHLMYLLNRGLSIQQIFLFNPVSIKEYPNYVFSLYSKSCLIGRCIYDTHKIKYIKLNNNNYVPYGYEYIHYNVNKLCIVEGIFDLFAVNSYLPTIALLGKTMSSYYYTWLQNIKPKEIIILLDNDAEKEMQNLYRICKFITPVTSYIVLPTDPWDCREFISQYLKI